MNRAALLILLLLPFAPLAAGEEMKLERAPIDPQDAVSLQRGAKVFVNYCLNCHSAENMRYQRLSDLGLTEAQIRDNLLFATDRVGDTMTVAMRRKDAKVWFGVAPPDLTVIARSRGADWLYTYLRTFYRDPKTTHGWNNAVFPNAAMPHALWTLQGERALEIVPHTDKAGHVALEYKWTQLSPGAQNTVQYDATVRDLVNFLAYVGEPAAQPRKHIGAVVLFVLSILFVFAFALKKAYWKDVH